MRPAASAPLPSSSLTGRGPTFSARHRRKTRSSCGSLGSTSPSTTQRIASRTSLRTWTLCWTPWAARSRSVHGEYCARAGSSSHWSRRRRWIKRPATECPPCRPQLAKCGGPTEIAKFIDSGQCKVFVDTSAALEAPSQEMSGRPHLRQDRLASRVKVQRNDRLQQERSTARPITKEREE